MQHQDQSEDYVLSTGEAHSVRELSQRRVFERLAFDESYTGYGCGEDCAFSVQFARKSELRWIPSARVTYNQTGVRRLDRERFCELQVLSWLRFYEECAPRNLGSLLSYV